MGQLAPFFLRYQTKCCEERKKTALENQKRRLLGVLDNPKNNWHVWYGGVKQGSLGVPVKFYGCRYGQCAKKGEKECFYPPNFSMARNFFNQFFLFFLAVVVTTTNEGGDLYHDGHNQLLGTCLVPKASTHPRLYPLYQEGWDHLAIHGAAVAKQPCWCRF